MRKYPVLDALFAGPVSGILTLVFTGPSNWWYMSDLAHRLGLRPSSLQKPLAALAAAGVLDRRRDGNRVYYRACSANPIFTDLLGMISKTSGIVGVLTDALEPFRAGIQVAFVYGSIAQSLERPESDVDLMVIGRTGRAALAPALDTAERRLRRPVNARIYTPEELQRRRKANDHFLESVLASERLFVVGNESDLGLARTGGASREAPNQRAGNAVPAGRGAAKPARRRTRRALGR